MAKSNGKSTKKTKSAANGSTSAAIAKVIAIATTLHDAIASLDLPGLTAEERIHSDGRLRKGEPAAMTSVFDTIDAYPALFTSLATTDGGAASSAVEPARAALSTAAALVPLAALIDSIHSTIGDAILSTASQAKAVSQPGYAIAKANASTNAGLRKSLAGALDFYGAAGRKRAEGNQRAANAAKKAAKKAKPAISATS
jgi:hypothetical protein